jgi:signal transduction histidine kinase/ligand-binding sensor domain-containing protein
LRSLVQFLHRNLRRPAGRFALCSTANLARTLAVLVWAPALVGAQDRLIRTYSQESGLQPPIWAVAQDSVGFLWVGAEGGLYRFDGSEFRRWAPEIMRDAIDGVTVSPGGIVAAVERSGRAFEITQTSARAIAGPEPVGPVGMGRFSYDRHGRLWLARGDTVFYRTTDGAWRTLAAEALDHERPRRLKANPVGGIDVMTPTAMWRVAPGEKSRVLLKAPWITDVWYYSADRFVAMTANPPGADRLIEVDQGKVRRLLANDSTPVGRAIAVIERQGTVWVAIDNALFAVRPGEPPDVLGRDEGINSGGPLLVDREGSLWMGSFVGLVHLPEPDTRTWTDRHGLHTRHARMLTKRGDALWITTWGGTDVLARTQAGWTISHSASLSQIRSCLDRRGVIWANGGTPAGVLEMDDGSMPRRHARPAGFEGCAASRDGGMWMALAETLFYAHPSQRAMRAYVIPASNGRRDVVLHDRSDRLWLSGGESICTAQAAQASDGPSAWTCDSLPGAQISSIIELSSGTLWAASLTTGVYARTNGRWVPVPTETLPTRAVFSLSTSPRGGVWMIGNGIGQRVDETPSGWRVLERLTGWHGLMTVGGGDVIEDDDGTIWISSARGVTRVPASSRMSAASAPPIVLVDARVDDSPVRVDSVLRLPHDRNRLELRFAALSFRAPSQVRHQVRLGPHQSWSESSSGASFRWVDLQPGQYAVEYRASLDGRTWFARPLRFEFSVSPPWYSTPWAIALALGFIAMVVWSVYRARVAYLLGLERQRTGIAMDLHDEVGSGLASVGILSGVLAAESLSVPERQQTAADIASAAEELGNALSDIVWSLDPHAATLEELASRLAEHGERLTARGDVEFTARLPEKWPEAQLEVAVRRNVLLVGLEALHNAARHSGATEVHLTLAPIDERWELVIRDNGVGMDASSTRRDGGGHGLPGMRRRAGEIGAWLDVTSIAGRGTTVRLRFGLRPGSRGTRAFTERLRRALSARLA